LGANFVDLVFSSAAFAASLSRFFRSPRRLNLINLAFSSGSFSCISMIVSCSRNTKKQSVTALAVRDRRSEAR
jgi:hypothetical protein